MTQLKEKIKSYNITDAAAVNATAAANAINDEVYSTRAATVRPINSLYTSKKPGGGVGVIGRSGDVVGV